MLCLVSTICFCTDCSYCIRALCEIELAFIDLYSDIQMIYSIVSKLTISMKLIYLQTC